MSLFAVIMMLLPQVAFAEFVDSDSDGLDDNWETGYLGSMAQNGNNDPDNDFLTNIEEFRNNSNPIANSNIAYGKRYMFSAPPSYAVTADSGDSTQLTDGIFDPGAGKRSVGWSDRSLMNLDIVIDLASAQKISAIKFSSTERRDYYFPLHAIIEISEDGVNYYTYGDIISQNKNPSDLPEHSDSIFTKYVFYFDDLNAFGRFVRLRVNKAGSYIILDEIMVFNGGNGAHLGQASEIAGNPPEVTQMRMTLLYIMDKIGAKASAEGLDLGDEFSNLKKSLMGFNLPIEDVKNFSSEFPKSRANGTNGYISLGELHAKVLALNAKVWKKQGFDGSYLWQMGSTWDEFSPIDSPLEHNASASFKMKLMNNQRVGDAFMISNATNSDKAYEISVEGLPFPNGSFGVFEVKTLETDQFGLYSDPILPLEKAGQSYRIVVPAGMTVQAWLEFNLGEIPPGSYSGKIVARNNSAVSAEMPIEVTVSNFIFPDDFSESFTAWEYLSARYISNPSRLIYTGNFQKTLEMAQKYQIDWPFGSNAVFKDRSVVNASDFDHSGKYQPPNGYYEWLDKWVRDFPDGKKFIIHWGLETQKPKVFADASFETQPEVFKQRLIAWIDALEEHIVKDLNMEPNQFILFFIDELHVEDDGYFIHWAKPLIERKPKYSSRILLYLDPVRADPSTSQVVDGKTIYDYVDILSPNFYQSVKYNQMYGNLDLLADFSEGCRQSGVYFGMHQGTQPYQSGVLSSWVGNKYGLSTSTIFDFASYGQGRSLNFYNPNRKTNYALLYFNGDDVYPSKRLEAFSTGRQDYEYLQILRSFREFISQKRPERTDLLTAIDARIEGSINSATGELLSDPNMLSNYTKDRGIAKRERENIWSLIDSLSKEFGIREETGLPQQTCSQKGSCGNGICGVNETPISCVADCSGPVVKCGELGNSCASGESCVSGVCIRHSCTVPPLSYAQLKAFEEKWLANSMGLLDFMTKILEWKRCNS